MTKAGKILRHYRTKVLGWSQEELGAATGFSNQYISKLEKQEYISELTRERLALVLGCNPDELRPDPDGVRTSEDSPPRRSKNALRAAQLIDGMSDDVLSRALPILEADQFALGCSTVVKANFGPIGSGLTENNNACLTNMPTMIIMATTW